MELTSIFMKLSSAAMSANIDAGGEAGGGGLPANGVSTLELPPHAAKVAHSALTATTRERVAFFMADPLSLAR
jgi:hypothetical protein